ncbi:MAG TPA: hypothetical protein VND64_03355 [Pirellulales bacterium]|nr:hypothetical protein [Pirellulales bacterium]
MARPKSEGPSRSQSIRNYMRANKGVTVPQIVDGLRAQGVMVTPGLVYQVKAAGRKKRAAKQAMKSVASTHSTGIGTGTKADLIRDAARGMKKPIRPRDVVATLKDQGTDVSRTQVSQVLARMGMKRKRRGSGKAAAGSAARSTNSTSISIDDLVAAKKLVGQVGSIEKVREALSALSRLG